MTKNVYIVYYSKTGNTKRLAERILDNFSELQTEDISIKLMSATELDLDALKAADGYVIGTPNYFGAPSGYVKIFFDELYMERTILKGRPVFCFISHGGSGDIERLRAMCNWLNLKVVGPTIVVSGSNITSKNLSDIESNIKKMLDLI
ncbi:MAG: flavodoxin family protein [Candidatus Hodarchaeota archaeon]